MNFALKIRRQKEEQNQNGYKILKRIWNILSFCKVLVRMFAVFGEKMMMVKFGCKAKSDNDKKIQHESNVN